MQKITFTVEAAPNDSSRLTFHINKMDKDTLPLVNAVFHEILTARTRQGLYSPNLSSDFYTAEEARNFYAALEAKGIAFENADETRKEFDTVVAAFDKRQQEVAALKPEFHIEAGKGVHPAASEATWDALKFEVSNLTPRQENIVFQLIQKHHFSTSGIGVSEMDGDARCKNMFGSSVNFKTISGTFESAETAAKFIETLQENGIAFGDLSQLQGEYKIPRTISMAISKAQQELNQKGSALGAG